MGRTACTEPQCLHKGAIFLTGNQMDRATRHFLFVNTWNAHNKQKHKGYKTIPKNFKGGLFDHEDKGTRNIQNVRN